MSRQSLYSLLAGCILLPGISGAADDARLKNLIVHSTVKSDIKDRVSLKGNISSNAAVEIGVGSDIDGSLLSGGSAVLRNYSVVRGNLNASGAPTMQEGAVVQGTKIATAAPSISIDNPSYSCGSNAVNFEPNTFSSLVPGTYGTVQVKSGATLKLSSGTYYISSLLLETNAKLNLDASAGIVRINTCGYVKFGVSSLVSVGGGDESKVRFHSKGTDQFYIDVGSRFVGTVSSPNGDIYVKSDNGQPTSETWLRGALWGKNVTIEKGAHMAAVIPKERASISGALMKGRTGDVNTYFTADNHYGLYYGKTDGTPLYFAGQNEFNEASGTIAGVQYSWADAEYKAFVVGPDDHIYIVVWDNGGFRMWMGQFNLNGGDQWVSDKEHWEYFQASGDNPGLNGNIAPTVSSVAMEISRANASLGWKPLLVSALHTDASQPWVYYNTNSDKKIWTPSTTDPTVHAGALPDNAQFVWIDDFGGTDNAVIAPNYYIFRSKDAVIQKVPLVNWTVYIDANGNGSLDVGERTTTTDSDGRYTFGDLDAGSYTVRQVTKNGYAQNLPSSNAAYVVAVSAGQAVIDKDFLSECTSTCPQ